MNVTPLFPVTRAVLAQFESEEALAPFVSHRAPAMLEVMAKPVLHHWLDALSHAGVKQVSIYACRFPDQIREFIREGERWGFDSVDVVELADIADWDDILPQINTNDMDNTVFANLGSLPVQPLNRLAVSHDFWFGNASIKSHGNEPAFAICNPKDLWFINMQMLTEERTHNIDPGTYVDPAVRMEGASRVAARVLLDQQNHLNNAVIGKDVTVAKGCELRDSVVMGNTALGSHLFAERMLIDGPIAYKVDTGCLLRVDDPAILTRLIPARTKTSNGKKMLARVLQLLS